MRTLISVVYDITPINQSIDQSINLREPEPQPAIVCIMLCCIIIVYRCSVVMILTEPPDVDALARALVQ